MRDIPELSLRGALAVLGHRERPMLDRLNTLLGGVVMLGGVVALTNPVTMPLAGVAAVWGWVDQKNEAMGLVRKLLDKADEWRSGARGQDRTRVVAAAHTLLAAGAVLEEFRRAVGKKQFEGLAITREELAGLFEKVTSSAQQCANIVYDSPVPSPSGGCGFSDNLARVGLWQERFAAALTLFCSGLEAGEHLAGNLNARAIGAAALQEYGRQYIELAAKVPEFAIWAMLDEHEATRRTILDGHAALEAALADQANAMSRLDAVLRAIGDDTPRAASALRLSTRSGLDEQLVTGDAAAMTFLPGIRFPLVREIFIRPRYRLHRVDRDSRIADEQWWGHVPLRDDIDLRIIGHLVSSEATRLPLLVLGHPGAGKSLVMKVLAARLPVEQYTAVYVPLRRVTSSASVYQQIEEGLVDETNGRANWNSLLTEVKGTTPVVLLDGLDEMLQAADRDRTGYLHDIAEFQWREAVQGRPVVVLVTSRTLVADRVDVPPGTTVVKVEEFDEVQVERWRRVWNSVNGEVIRAGVVRELTPEAVAMQRDLARQPLLLLMLALYSADPAFPAIESGLSRTALYRTLFDNFTKRESRKLPRGEGPEEQTSQLAVAALGMFNRGRQHLSDVELAADLAVLAPDGAEHERLVAQFFFVHTSEENAGSTKARRSYEFLHATFGEYLVAREVIDTLIDTADSAVSRRGVRDPDDDRLFALLSHDCLAVRGPILDFAKDMLDEEPSRDRDRLRDVVTMLIEGSRRRQGSTRLATYQPNGTDHIRAIAAYSGNLVLLLLLLEGGDKVDVKVLFGGPVAWRSTLDLWRSGLVADSWHAMLTVLRGNDGALRLNLDSRSGTLSPEVKQAHLAGDELTANTFNVGATIRDAMRDDRRHERIVDHRIVIIYVLQVFFSDSARFMPAKLLSDAMEEIPLEDERLPGLLGMVLRLRSWSMRTKQADAIVRFLLSRKKLDVFSYIAAISAHPSLIAKYPRPPQDAHLGFGGAELMLQAAMVLEPETRDALSALLPTPGSSMDSSIAADAAAMLLAFQWPRR